MFHFEYFGCREYLNPLHFPAGKILDREVCAI